MSDLQIFFLVLVALYGWECACWLKRGSIAYRTWFGRLFRAAHPVGLFGNQKGGFVFAAPLPPLGTIFVACQSPVSYSPDAVLAFIAASVNPGSRPPQSGKLFAFDEIRSVSAVARKVFINGEPFLRAASPGLAVRIVNELQELKSLPATKRPKSIQNIVRDSLDTKAIEQRCREFKDQTQSLLLLT